MQNENAGTESSPNRSGINLRDLIDAHINVTLKRQYVPEEVRKKAEEHVAEAIGEKVQEVITMEWLCRALFPPTRGRKPGAAKTVKPASSIS